MIRLVQEQDIKAIREIYAYYVEHDSATFDVEVPSKEAMKQRIQEISSVYPYYVYELNGCVIGYAYAHPYYGRKAYLWNVEVSVYVHKDYLHQKIGSKLYQQLFETLKELGYYKAYACITASNKGSIKMHEVFNFKEIGYFKEAGYKFKTWWDVIWMEKIIQNVSKEVIEPKAINN